MDMFKGSVKTLEKSKTKDNNSSVNRKKFIYATIILICIYIVFVLIMLYNEYVNNKVINISTIDVINKKNQTELSPLNDFYVVKNIPKDDTIIKGAMYFPSTKDETLNKYIQINVDKYISQFYKLIEGKDLKTNQYNLDVFFDTYIGDNSKYISFVFYISMDTGWVHPNSYIWSVIYDVKNKEIIDIDNLVKKYPSFLVNISEYSYGVLFKNEKIKDNGAVDILKNGTKPTKQNFRNLAIDKDKLIVFFEKYQVAPYVLGEFKVEILIKEILK